MNQVVSVGEFALNIASLGTTKAGTDAARKAYNAHKYAELKKKYDAFKANHPMIAEKLKQAEKAKKVVSDAKSKVEFGQEVVDTVSDALENDPSEMTAADYVRVSAEVASLMDPTGVAGVVAGYSFPRCHLLGR